MHYLSMHPKIGFDKNVVYVGICCYLDDEQGKITSFHSAKIQSLEELLQIRTIWHNGGSIDQPAVLFPRELALSFGGLDPDNQRTMDYELWGKFFLAGASVQYTNVHFGIFRQHPDQKTFDMLSTTRIDVNCCCQSLSRAAACFPEEQKALILAELDDYGRWYKEDHWRRSGRLARLGLPPSIVSTRAED